MRWARRVYPVLFAVFPPLSIVTNRPTYIAMSDVALVCLVAVGGAALLVGVLYALFRVRMRPEPAGDAAALGAFAAVGLFYAYGPLRTALSRVPHPSLLLLAGSVAAAGGLWAFRRALRRRLPSPGLVGRYLTTVGVLLVVWSLAQLGINAVVGARAVGRSELIQALARPLPVRGEARPPGRDGVPGGAVRKRDVFVIVLDEYASSDVLREQFDFDNSAFEDSLRALGFRLPVGLRSNYPSTLLSVASLLNFAQLRPLASDMSANSKVVDPVAHLIEHNRAATFLKRQGYRYVLFPSAWFAPTRASDEADVRFDPYTRFDLARAMYASQFRAVLVSRTMLDLLRGRLRAEAEVHAEHAARTFEGLATLPEAAQPTFAFAHVLLPHPPWIVDSTCRALRPGSASSHGWDGSPEMREMYRNQVRCVNRQTLRMVRRLIARSDVQPIIILQGDHGTESLDPDLGDTALPTVEQARERFRPFGAYYLPDGGGAAIPDSTSLVNVLRYVFTYYFHADLPPLPNTMYYSSWRPYDLVEIDDTFRPTGGE